MNESELQLPMGRFPLPNPLVRPRRGRVLAYSIATTTFLMAAAAFAASVTWLCVTFPSYPKDLPQSVRTVSSISATVSVIGLPLSILLLWLTRRIGSSVSRRVILVRVVHNEALQPDTRSPLAFGLAAILSPAGLFAGLVGSALSGEPKWLYYEHIRRRRIRRGRAAIPLKRILIVQPGDVIWIVPPGLLRQPNTWSEVSGHGGADCHASARFARWFEMAEARAAHARIARRRARKKGIAAVRRRRGTFTKRA